MLCIFYYQFLYWSSFSLKMESQSHLFCDHQSASLLSTSDALLADIFTRLASEDVHVFASNYNYFILRFCQNVFIGYAGEKLAWFCKWLWIDENHVFPHRINKWRLKSDHRSYEHYSDNSENEAWKKGCTLYTERREYWSSNRSWTVAIGLVEMKCN